MDDMERSELARDTANKITRLLIARRDAKAFTSKGEWFASKSEITLTDFENHLFGEKCMGTYLLDKKSRIKFVAFDIDLTGPGAYFEIRDLDEIEAMEAEGKYDGELDPDHHFGMYDVALHDETHAGYRWVRSCLGGVVRMVCDRVESDLGLPALPVITGGGAHVIVPFGERVAAAEGRAAAHGVLDGLVGFRRTSDNFYTNADDDAPLDNSTKRPMGETMSIEVFPKQDSLSGPDSYGNLIRLPFGWHAEAGMRTYVMDTQPGAPSWELRKRSSVEALDEAMDRVCSVVSK